MVLDIAEEFEDPGLCLVFDDNPIIFEFCVELKNYVVIII